MAVTGGGVGFIGKGKNEVSGVDRDSWNRMLLPFESETGLTKDFVFCPEIFTQKDWGNMGVFHDKRMGEYCRGQTWYGKTEVSNRLRHDDG